MYLAIICLFTSFCFGGPFEIATQEECSLMMPDGRSDCVDSLSFKHYNTERDCQSAGCCWDEMHSHCYSLTNCKPGYFGWRCQLRCRCPGGGRCSRWTGRCDNPCTAGYWGVGCLLENNCTYSDPLAVYYTGSRQHADDNTTCQPWSMQKTYDQFPDDPRDSPSNFCRNPDFNNPYHTAWCFISKSSSHQQFWRICTFNSCVCPVGRYGPNCVHECHCRNPQETCDAVTGKCPSSGCHPRWSGLDCAECSDGYFGNMCQYDCKCNSPEEVCDKSVGSCESSCLPGWQGISCHEECGDGSFGLNCEFRCNCRQRDEVCAKATGRCESGCREKFGGEGCQAELPHLSRIPRMKNNSDSSITIEWHEASDKVGASKMRYQVFFRPQGREDWIIAANNELINRSLMVTNLIPDSKYEFQVTPVSDAGLVGLPSPVLKAYTCGKPLSGVVNLTFRLLPEKDEAISLDWKIPKRDQWNCLSFVGYHVYVSNSSDDSQPLSLYNFVSTARIVIKNVDLYQNLTIAVTFVNLARLESIPVFETYVGRSGAVEDLEAQGSNTSSILLTWVPPKISNGVILNYLLTYRLMHFGGCRESKQGNWIPLIDIDSSQNQLEVSGLSVYSLYTFKLYPKTSSGRGRESVVNGSTHPTEPQANLTLKLVSINFNSATVSWRTVDCQKWNGDFVGYVYELYAYPEYGSADVNESTADGKLFLSGSVNQTKVVLAPLTPYLNYTLVVWFANHRYGGSKSSIAMETDEHVPLSPKNVRVESKTSESLNVVWSRPHPPQGMITRYLMRYFAVQNTRSLSTTITIDNASTLNFNITKLLPFEQYRIMVRASTRVGDGLWSELVEEFTDESVPSSPLDLMNTSRSSKDFALQWKAPVHANGVIRFYSVTCTSANPLNREKVPPVEKVVSPPCLNLTVTDLMPGVNYGCKVSASTKKGEGPPTWLILWTEPEISFEMPAPVLKQSQTVDNLIVIDLQPSSSVDYMEEPDSLYRVVVEMLDEEAEGRMRREALSVPCGLRHSDLVHHSLALSRGLRCYIAAEIPRIVSSRNFVVGDNKTYGGYYNARLDSNLEHDVWFGLVVTVDGVTVSSYSKTDQPNRAKSKNKTLKTTVKHAEGLSSLTPATGAVVGSLTAIIFIAVLIILLTYKIFQRRRKNLRPSSIVMFDSNTDSIGEQNAKLLPVEPPENPVKTRNSIPVSQLWDHVVPSRHSDYDNLRAEFDEFQKEILYKVDAARKTDNKPKNRYHNIFPYDHSRVILDCLPNDPHSDYINANYIDGYNRSGAFVAAQGPVDATLDDTWRMIWQLNSRVIVMVTNLHEGGRQKCKQYWPDAGSQQYGEILVATQNVEEYADYIVRTLVVSKKAEKRTIKQFHFTTWPDHGIPEHPTSLLEFRKKVRHYGDDELQKDASCGPCVVHCSAGVGRTGCYIALDYSLDLAREEGCVDVFNFVKKMRDDRINMIQTPEQYIFVYEALLEALQAGVTSILCSEFRSRYAELTTVNPDTEKSYLLEEFELLESTNLLYTQEDTTLDSLTSGDKNQNNRGWCRLIAGSAKKSIDAIFVDGYKHRNAFLVTQSPTPSNVAEFWAAFVENHCGAIICLENQCHKENNEFVYFPTTMTENLEVNPFSIKLISSDYSPYFDQQEFVISSNSKVSRGAKDVKVRRFKVKSWTMSYNRTHSTNETGLPSRSSILALLGALEKWQQHSGNPTVLVHCRDAATHSGLFCAASFLIEKLKIEHEVDVFFSIRHIRVNRPQFLPNLTQYQYLYDLAIDYLDCFDTYANFESSI